MQVDRGSVFNREVASDLTYMAARSSPYRVTLPCRLHFHCDRVRENYGIPNPAGAFLAPEATTDGPKKN